MAVHYARRGCAAVLTIDRPERRNAIDGDTAAALLDGFERFCGDDAARVLVLTGAGDVAFCAGADLKAIGTLDPDAPGGPLGFSRLTSPKPTIAAVSGWCLAGGFELALWCDLRLATPTAVFGCAERRWGVPLIDGGTQRRNAADGETASRCWTASRPGSVARCCGKAAEGAARFAAGEGRGGST